MTARGLRIVDPATTGRALAALRQRQGLTRHGLAALVAKATGRRTQTVVSQLEAWEGGEKAPKTSSLGPYLEALGFDLAFLPRKEAP